jgi:hypothetical protein
MFGEMIELCAAVTTNLGTHPYILRRELGTRKRRAFLAHDSRMMTRHKKQCVQKNNYFVHKMGFFVCVRNLSIKKPRRINLASCAIQHLFLGCKPPHGQPRAFPLGLAAEAFADRR